MTQTVLILGASGRFGHNMAEAFTAAGWIVRRFDRGTDDLTIAAKGADIIVAGWNPKYNEWSAQVPQLHAQIRKAALDNDATVILPGNVYVNGAAAPVPWNENTPHLAGNPLGQIRKDMEQAYRREGVKTILLRAGDYIDTRASGNWFDQIIAKPLGKGRLSYPGDLSAPHAWAFLPDVARAAVMLAEKRHMLAQFEDIPFPGYTLSAQDMANVLTQTTGKTVSLRKMAWFPLRLAAPFMPIVKHLFEMRYLWSLPQSLDGSKFRRLLPGFVETPLDQALKAATAPILDN